VTALVEADGAAFRYPGRDSAIGPFSLAVHAGELHHLLGPSGCGKSTYARMLAGLIPHLYRGELSGCIRAGTQRTEDMPLWQLSARIGLVGQNAAAQLLAATVRDEIIFGLENLGLSRADVKARLDAACDAFGLGGVADRDPRYLSGGEQQKVVLAAIAARRPEVVVLDEAFSMLDATSVAEVTAQVQRLHRDGTAVVAFDHSPPHETWPAALHRRVLARRPPVDPPLPELPRCRDPLALEVHEVGVTLGGRRILDGVHLSLVGGQVVAVVGANGAGKTTLLRVLAGLQPYTGRISAGRGRPRLGLCFQNADQQIFNPTVRQEILFGNDAVDARLYGSIIDLLGLGPYERTPPVLLSEGEKKRLALAIVLMRPDLAGVCLDEPTLGQDDLHRRRIGRVVRQLAAAGYLCVVATHDREWVAEWCDTLVLLEAGRVVERQPAMAERQSLATEEPCPANV
jgi:energy-coupling factor transporter ATP-binding protein EcfA2